MMEKEFPMSHINKRKCRNLMTACFAMALSLPAMSQAQDVSATFPSVAAVSRSATADASDTLALVVDFAVVMQIDGDIGSIVLGNAAIADAMVADGKMIVLTGNTVGMTNMIVLDANNQILAQFTLKVSGRKPGTVTVRRALEIQSYGCGSGLCTESSVELVDASTELVQAPL
jgi:hypothetical protein